jgi:hypothetical protein
MAARSGAALSLWTRALTNLWRHDDPLGANDREDLKTCGELHALSSTGRPTVEG